MTFVAESEGDTTIPIRMLARSGKPIEHSFWGRVVHDMSGMKLHNGRTIGGGNGKFSNGDAIGGPNSPWDNPSLRQAPFVNTPSTDPMQALNARLGLNGYQPNTSDPSGRAAAAGLVKVWNVAMEAMQEKVKDVSAAADAYFTPLIESTQQRIDAAMKNAGEVVSQSSGAQAIATLDATFARQQFGNQSSREVDLLTRIDQNGAKLLNFFQGERWNRGIPGGPG